jgi:hypothetical protein
VGTLSEVMPFPPGQVLILVNISQIKKWVVQIIDIHFNIIWSTAVDSCDAGDGVSKVGLHV